MIIVNAGCNYRHPHDFCINRPHGSGDYILLILKTAAYFVFPYGRVVAPPHAVVIFKKGTPQLYGAVSDEYVNDWIHFDITAEEEAVIQTLGIPMDTVLPLQDTTVLSGFIKDIFCEKYSQNVYKEESMQLYFDLLMRKLAEQIRVSAAQKEQPYWEELHRLRNEILLAPQRDWNVNAICRSLNLSRSYVQHLYKNLFGTSVMADVLHGRMEYAKYLLSSTDFTVYNIASMCGYANDTHFMRLFKKTVGVTPSAYRETYRVSRWEVASSKARNPFCL